MTETVMPLISICTITYNHAAYIAQTLDSFVMQQTGFPFEVIVCDDCSTDDTYAIIQAYAKRFPELIFPKRQPRNVGMNENFLQALHRCRGKYIALCDGDDYWTDAGKLQTQVRFLEDHPDYQICFHKVAIQMDGPAVPFPDYNEHTPETTTLKDLMLKGNYIHTPSCVFRNNVDALPAWFSTAMPPDYFLHLLNAGRGKIRLLAGEMSTYRVHAGSMWQDGRKTIHRRLAYLRTMRTFLRSLDQGAWKADIRERYKSIKRDYLFVAIDELKSRRWLAAMGHVAMAVFLGPGLAAFFANNIWMLRNAARDLREAAR